MRRLAHQSCCMEKQHKTCPSVENRRKCASRRAFSQVNGKRTTRRDLTCVTLTRLCIQVESASHVQAAHTGVLRNICLHVSLRQSTILQANSPSTTPARSIVSFDRTVSLRTQQCHCDVVLRKVRGGSPSKNASVFVRREAF